MRISLSSLPHISGRDDEKSVEAVSVLGQHVCETRRSESKAIGCQTQINDTRVWLAMAKDKFTEIAKTNPQFAGKKALLLEGAIVDDSVHVVTPDWRSDFLTQMGLSIPDTGGSAITRDKMASALNGTDVLIWTTENDDQQAALLADPTVAKLNATIGNRNVFTGKDLAGAIAFASPLSYPVVADQLTPALAKALG